MRQLVIAAALAGLTAATATAQTTTGSTPATNGATATSPMPGNAPVGGMANPGTAATAAPASGNDNQAVATTSVNAPAPAKGANSFTMGEAATRIADHGFTGVTGLKKDQDGVWRGQASKSGQPVTVWLDYKGNVGQQ